MYRQTFGGPAQYLVHHVSQMPQGSRSTRYAKIFATFFISGVLHWSADLAMGMALSESGSVRFFCIQALGIFLEDVFQAIYHHVFPTRTATVSSKPGKVAKVFGYLWVGIFLSWSTPIWAYPAMRRNLGQVEDQVLPFSIVKYYGYVQ